MESTGRGKRKRKTDAREPNVCILQEKAADLRVAWSATKSRNREPVKQRKKLEYMPLGDKGTAVSAHASW